MVEGPEIRAIEVRRALDELLKLLAKAIAMKLKKERGTDGGTEADPASKVGESH